jgi:hypothetical protein
MDPFGIATFCDDIREEVGGKISLIGCYGPDMQFTGISFPIVIPKLGVHVTSRFPVEPVPAIKLLLYLPGDLEDAPSMSAELPVPDELRSTPDANYMQHMLASLPDGEPSRVLRYYFIVSPAPIREEGFVRVRMMYGDQRIKLGSLKICNVEAKSPTIAARS